MEFTITVNIEGMEDEPTLLRQTAVSMVADCIHEMGRTGNMVVRNDYELGGYYTTVRHLHNEPIP